MALQTDLVEPRTAEILACVKTVFAAKGFDGASMQDLARAAGMSAGNFYRYFPSKNAIVEALIERHLDEMRREFARVLESARPLQSLRDLVRHRVETLGGCDGPIWAEIEAAAGRREEVAMLMLRTEAEVTRNLVAVFARIAALPEPEAERRFSAHARLFVLLIQGLSMRARASGGQSSPPDRDLASLVVAIIENTLAEISAAAPARVETLSEV